MLGLAVHVPFNVFNPAGLCYGLENARCQKPKDKNSLVLD
jgi:hypothetical protein